MVQVAEQTSIRFRVWDFDSFSWVEDDYNNYVELNWFLVGETTIHMEGFVEVIPGVNAVIILPDDSGHYEEPKS
jgi:hypothetical protein